MGNASIVRGLSLSLLAFAMPLHATPSVAQDALSVMSFGGAYQEAQRKAVFETYAAGTGISLPSRSTVARSPRSRR